MVSDHSTPVAFLGSPKMVPMSGIPNKTECTSEHAFVWVPFQRNLRPF